MAKLKAQLNAIIDASAQDWSRENNWICPPESLIVPSVRKLKACSGVGTLIVPEWPSAVFWPFVHASPLKFRSFVKDVFILPKIDGLLCEVQDKKQFTKPSVFNACPKFNMLALSCKQLKDQS